MRDEEIGLESDHDNDGDYMFNATNRTNSLKQEDVNKKWQEDVLTGEDFLKFVTETLNPDIPFEGRSNSNNEDNKINNFINHAPTTDFGELALEIEETIKYGGTSGKIIISGHGILN